ncbi:MAG: hydrogenase small subunit, partial [Actinomycetota bacterium]|nr:hydrogenase small subunit [Actinomycetota bacterium]
MVYACELPTENFEPHPPGGAPEEATMPTATSLKAEETLIHVLWINAGLSCDGDSVALTAATQPSVEEIALGA